MDGEPFGFGGPTANLLNRLQAERRPQSIHSRHSGHARPRGDVSLDVHAVEVPWGGNIAALLHITPFLFWLLLHRNQRQGAVISFVSYSQHAGR